MKKRRKRMSPTARKAISARMKMYWAGRRDEESDAPKRRKVVRRKATRDASKPNGHVPTSNRHLVTILSRDQNGLTREQHSIDTWGQLFDILTMQYSGIRIDEVRIECNSIQTAASTVSGAFVELPSPESASEDRADIQ
jgi:hypothetical protein